eukprot:1159973-Pelagomonas_calceolata.AAC.8
MRRWQQSAARPTSRCVCMCVRACAMSVCHLPHHLPRPSNLYRVVSPAHLKSKSACKPASHPRGKGFVWSMCPNIALQATLEKNRMRQPKEAAYMKERFPDQQASKGLTNATYALPSSGL